MARFSLEQPFRNKNGIEIREYVGEDRAILREIFNRMSRRLDVHPVKVSPR